MQGSIHAQGVTLSRRGALSSAVALTVLPRSLPARAKPQAVPLADLPMQRCVPWRMCAAPKGASILCAECRTDVQPTLAGGSLQHCPPTHPLFYFL